MYKSLILVTYIYLYKSLPKIITRSYPRSLSYFTEVTKATITRRKISWANSKSKVVKLKNQEERLKRKDGLRKPTLL